MFNQLLDFVNNPQFWVLLNSQIKGSWVLAFWREKNRTKKPSYIPVISKTQKVLWKVLYRKEPNGFWIKTKLREMMEPCNTVGSFECNMDLIQEAVYRVQQLSLQLPSQISSQLKPKASPKCHTNAKSLTSGQSQQTGQILLSVCLQEWKKVENKAKKPKPTSWPSITHFKNKFCHDTHTVTTF